MLGYIGIDASKGYADFCVLSDSGETLLKTRADDTWRGHRMVHEQLRQLLREGKVSGFEAAIESSGGVERNWLHGFRSLSPEDRINRVLHINPLYVVKQRELNLHLNVTDASSARTIAEVLKARTEIAQRPDDNHEVRRLQTRQDELIAQRATLKTQLKSTLVTSHPELVQFCRSDIHQWLLRVLAKWPTMKALSKAKVDELAKIPYVTQTRARELVDLAQRSVASTSSAATVALLRSLVSHMQYLTKLIKENERHLNSYFRDDKVVEILQSLPGIGPAVSRLLRLYYGDFQTFHSEAAVVAFAGLDPRIKQSGDSEKHRGISRRGRPSLRGYLFNAATAAIRCDERFRAHFERLVKRGKPPMVAIVAVMAKLLRIAYACVMKSKKYVKGYQSATAPRSPAVWDGPTDLSAPVSRREAKKRAAATNGAKPH